MIDPSQLLIGTHFWALINNEIAVMLKLNDGYFICGPWECSINENNFEVLAIISKPPDFTYHKTYYSV